MRKDFGESEKLRFFIGDVRDRDRLRRAMEGVELVIHAAALKRVEVGQYNPGEMVKTNVTGAMNVIESAQDAGVKTVVAISSDKACEPLNAYGKSKAMAEDLFTTANNTTRSGKGPRFCVVRYGNVAASAGSVIPIWREFLKMGQTRVPVTDPECTRFWMTIEEATDLVLWAASSKVTTIAVPALPAYRLGDLAEAMGATPEVMGLGGGEKRHETMISSNEAARFSLHDGMWVMSEGRAILEGALTSDKARRMSVDELKVRLESV
jgi:UDP-N-acetylglucosamine 4,6-dehydratase